MTPEPYEAQVVEDSVANGVRLTTLVVTFPRMVLSEFNTHRVFSRNSASSRAIPVKKRIKSVREQPFVPEAFGANKRGMQAGEELADGEQKAAAALWREAMEASLNAASKMADLGVHKQWANRLLEPFSWHTVIVTATEWDNYFALRISEDAQPEIHKASVSMRKALDTHVPRKLEVGDWHLPLVSPEERTELGLEVAKRVSAARCARVSYLTHAGIRDISKDLELYDRLVSHGHMSPLEHPAMVSFEKYGFIGNFRAPWKQLRKFIHGEDVFRSTR